MGKTRKETRIQRAALVCKSHLSSSATLHFPAFPDTPVWSFTISHLPRSPTPPQHYPPWIPTSCFIFCIPRRQRRRHMCNRRRESSFENLREGRQQRHAVSDTSSWQLGPPRGGKKTCAPAGGEGDGGGAKLWDVLWYKHVGATALSKKPQNDEIWMALGWGGTKEWNFVVRWSGEFLGSVSQRMLLPLKNV